MAAPLSIVHVLRAPMGGVLRHVRDLTTAHAAMGHRIGLICDRAGTEGYNEAMLEALRPHLALGLHRVPMARSVGLDDLGAARATLRILKTISADIVHGHGAKGGVYARAVGGMASRKAPAARLYSPHGGSLHYDPTSKAGKVYFAVERMLERSCETILFVADYERRTYLAKIGEPKCATRIVYNGLAKDEWHPVETIDAPADLLFIGEIRMLKGPDLFVAAIDRLKARLNRPISAIMVGTGPDQTQIANQIKQHGLADRIMMRPAMPARDAFALARVMVMPSRAEAMPYIVLEAVGADIALIATDVGGIAEIVGSDSASLTAPDADQLADKIAQAIDDPGRFRQSAQSRIALESRFSVSAMAHNVLDAYQDSLAMRRSNPNLSQASTPAKGDP